MHIINCKYQLCRLLIFNVLISFSDILVSDKTLQNSGKKCLLALEVPYAIQEDWSKFCKSPAAYGVKSAATSMSYRHAAGQNQLHPGQALCLEVLSVWNGGFLVQLFIGLPRAYQGFLAPMQCHLQAYVGRTPCVHQMHAKFERLN